MPRRRLSKKKTKKYKLVNKKRARRLNSLAKKTIKSLNKHIVKY